MLLKVHLDTEASNKAYKKGSLAKTMESALENLHPEAAYFTTDEGERTAFIVFDMQDPSQMPKLSEPLFEEFDAKISYTPVMNVDDMRKGLAAAPSGG